MFESITGLLLTIAGAIGAITTIWKVILRPIWGSYKKLSQIYTTLEEHVPTIVNISKEFQPNGGGSIKDILNRIDKNTQGSISRIWTLLENTPFAYFETDALGLCVKVNSKWLKLSNLNLDEYKGHGWVNGIHHKDRARVSDEWAETIIQKREFNSIYTMSSGVVVNATAQPIKANNGEILGWIGHLEQIAA